MNKKRTLIIVQPYVPEYRVGFFSNLIDTLADHNVQCWIAAASPPAQQSARGDAAVADWIIPFRSRSLRIAGRTLGLGGARPLWHRADGVIVGHLGSSLDTYLAIGDGKCGRMKVGVWGHIKSYVNDGHPLDLALEKWQLRNVDHVFAYSPGGRDYGIAAGVDSTQITTVMNSTDTTTLSQAKNSLDVIQLREFMNAHGLTPGRTLGFIGGLDYSKRIDFLSQTLDRLWLSDPDVKILIGGRGELAGMLKTSVDRGQAIMLGYADSVGQALIARASSALLMPGRIGLVAVDALVLGIPIITTDWKYHAPEAEFLVEGESCFTAIDDVDSYVSLVRTFLQERSWVEDGNHPSWRYPTIDGMVRNFSSGVLKMLDAPGPA